MSKQPHARAINPGALTPPSRASGYAAARDLANAINQTILGCFHRLGFAGCSEPTQRAKDAASCALKHQASQHIEDLLLLPTLLLATGFQPGVFVELGALDGVRYSNTLVLERCFNWRGILIEANPHNFAKLQASGRRATKIHSGVCSGTGFVTMTVGGSEESADVEALPKNILKGMQQRRKISNATVDVPCRSLSSIMHGAGIDSADFLSLDVQGAEYKVLETVDPGALKTVIVETYGAGITDKRFGKNGKSRLQLIRQRMASGRLFASSSVHLYGSDFFTRPDLQLVPVRTPQQSTRLREQHPNIAWCAKQAIRRQASSGHWGEWWHHCNRTHSALGEVR